TVYAASTIFSAIDSSLFDKGLKFISLEPIAKVLKREEFVIPTKVGIQSFQYVAKISGFPFARE
ncbi:MAG: hypothetical protein Q8N95_08900, partial [Desulfobacterales bacterium]|nr:hypothetical protein [Desulfobacterales bacterium]